MEPNSSDIDTEVISANNPKMMTEIFCRKYVGVLKKLSKKHLRLPPSSLPSWWASFKLTLTVKQFGPERLN